MNTIPTAEKYMRSKGFLMSAVHSGKSGTILITDVMIEFAKLHTEEQKEIIKQNLEQNLMDTFGISLTDDFALEKTGNSIIDDAYPTTNIK